jgi:hypothetical protein
MFNVVYILPLCVDQSMTCATRHPTFGKKVRKSITSINLLRHLIYERRLSEAVNGRVTLSWILRSRWTIATTQKYHYTPLFRETHRGTWKRAPVANNTLVINIYLTRNTSACSKQEEQRETFPFIYLLTCCILVISLLNRSLNPLQRARISGY